MKNKSMMKTLMTAAAAALGYTVLSDGYAFAAGDSMEVVQNVMMALLLMLLLAKLGGDLMIRIGQPAVLGELLFGIVLGNVSLVAPGMGAWLKSMFDMPDVAQFVRIFSELGVMLLLFEVGLESTVREMMSVGASSFLVAVMGVVTPVALGFFVGEVFLKGEPYTVHLFLGAVLAATSVGITARVLTDLGKMHLRESKIILGAAVIDDVLGLIVMAVATGMVAAVNAGKGLDVMSLGLIVVKSLVFFVVAMLLGGLLARRLFNLASYLRGTGMLITTALIWMFLVSWIGTMIGLAPIIGAFAAGLVLEDLTVKNIAMREHTTLHELMSPLTSFLVPVFFVSMGMHVDLRTFGDVSILGFAACLTFAAFIGKQVCSFGVLERGLNRWAVGVGMVPRGEVGLIVAGIGAKLTTAEGHPVISSATFSAAVIMVIVTTMVTPPLLAWVFNRSKNTPDAALPPVDAASKQTE